MKRLYMIPAVLMALGLAAGASAQPSQHGGAHQKHMQKEKTEKLEGMPAMCKAMMAKHGEMVEMMQSKNARLDEKLAAMEKATGDQRTERMADVIRELVVQRKEMQTQMMGDMHNMMGHMMNHMQGGMMSECPMMQGMMKKDDSGLKSDAHSQHGH